MPVSGIVSSVTAAAANILDAPRVVLAAAPGETWGPAPESTGGQSPTMTAALTGQDGRAIGTLEVYGKDAEIGRAHV